ncbi:MAG: hypothetical protein LJE70_12025 [Chromatiaceae bacterium]|nr:hypothetical protein [Chromatiaceae bacterium]
MVHSVVDEIAFQTRRGLAQRALADVIRFGARDESTIRAGARELAAGGLPTELPPRFLVSASRYALGLGADPQSLSKRVIEHLSQRPTLSRAAPRNRGSACSPSNEERP